MYSSTAFLQIDDTDMKPLDLSLHSKREPQISELDKSQEQKPPNSAGSRVHNQDSIQQVPPKAHSSGADPSSQKREISGLICASFSFQYQTPRSESHSGCLTVASGTTPPEFQSPTNAENLSLSHSEAAYNAQNYSLRKSIYLNSQNENFVDSKDLSSLNEIQRNRCQSSSPQQKPHNENDAPRSMDIDGSNEEHVSLWTPVQPEKKSTVICGPLLSKLLSGFDRKDGFGVNLSNCDAASSRSVVSARNRDKIYTEVASADSTSPDQQRAFTTAPSVTSPSDPVLLFPTVNSFANSLFIQTSQPSSLAGTLPTSLRISSSHQPVALFTPSRSPAATACDSPSSQQVNSASEFPSSPQSAAFCAFLPLRAASASLLPSSQNTSLAAASRSSVEAPQQQSFFPDSSSSLAGIRSPPLSNHCDYYHNLHCSSTSSASTGQISDVYKQNVTNDDQPICGTLRENQSDCSSYNRPHVDQSEKERHFKGKIKTYKSPSNAATHEVPVCTSTTDFDTIRNRNTTIGDHRNQQPSHLDSDVVSTKISLLDFWISKALLEGSIEAPPPSKPRRIDYICSANGDKKIRLRLVDLMELQVEQSLKA